MTDEFEVAVGSDGVRVAARGHGVERLMDALVGFVTPMTEGAAAIGDAVRMYRQRSAIRGLARARELADELGVPIRPVEPKFLVNWIEGASLEEENAPLTELWAGLLVSGTRGLKPNHLRFQRMLREMTGQHYEFFQYLCDSSANLVGDNLKDRRIKIQLNIENKSTTLSESPTIEYAREKAFALEAPGLKWIELEYGRIDKSEVVNKGKVHHLNMNFFPFFTDGTYKSLKDSGLITQDAISFRGSVNGIITSGSVGFVIYYCYISRLGIEFIYDCTGKEPPETSLPYVNQPP